MHSSFNSSPSLDLSGTSPSSSTLPPPPTSSHQHRRSIADPEANRFLGAKLEDFSGKLYDLCKDHNGCRFLQKKLEDPNGQHLQTIFDEIHPHFVELMTDPFGNYLCQKLVERCNDTQRTAIVDTISPDLLQICLSMHGTRAIQKLIEYLSTSHQIQTVTSALHPNVVTLIKDLNGNHVIQKCLHRLSAEHNQFIYDIVSEHCIEVATHRHGCCVLQRCIDHAVDAQKSQLVQVVTCNALPLVQDPFGNYVVQYVLDLGEVQYSDLLVRRLIEHVCDLSVQKFSSNVIEKCIRVSEPEIRRALITELINQSNMEKLLRDSFANYVIQTCLDYADQDQKVQLVERIRPHLASIRSTPYGKRIHSKIQREQQGNSNTNNNNNRYVSRQMHFPSMPSLRMNANNNNNGLNGYHHHQHHQDDSMVGIPLNYNMGLLGNSHPLYPFP
ncbi:armadillo-type protein [Cunninghamella echinulata]|nr:armadillo-type protein [Cunninghamella echinulata]